MMEAANLLGNSDEIKEKLSEQMTGFVGRAQLSAQTPRQDNGVQLLSDDIYEIMLNGRKQAV